MPIRLYTLHTHTRARTHTHREHSSDTAIPRQYIMVNRLLLYHVTLISLGIGRYTSYAVVYQQQITIQLIKLQSTYGLLADGNMCADTYMNCRYTRVCVRVCTGCTVRVAHRQRACAVCRVHKRGHHNRAALACTSHC